ncbi:MAG: type II toxin-antitoxin system VapC family toxin [Taibaiella sp.]|nr:type II toxin-antitoxin system VapC family toxin [Taibaiella sp.]
MNGNKIVLDTNIILYLLAGDETVSAFLQNKEGYVSVITEMELIGYPDITTKELKQIKSFLEDCTIIDINEEIKDTYVAIRKKYRQKLGDAITTATAIYLDIPLMTADKGFNKITELQLTSYLP